MKPINFILAVVVTLWMGLFSWGAYRVYESYTAGRDPLRAEKLELQRAAILRDTEKERQKTEEAKRKTAKTLAAIDRQAKLESNQGVNLAAVALAMSWRLSFPLLLCSGLIGGGVYLWRKPVLFEFEGVRAFLPRHAVPEVTQQALVTKQQAEMVKALAYAEGVTQERVTQIVDTVKALRPGREAFNISNQSALPAVASEQPQRAENVPTFQEILANLDEGDQMIFGYDTTTGEPITGDFSRLYSSFIGGRSGSGKTSALRGLILQSLKTTPDIEYLIHDPHAEHRESLAQTLPKCRQIRFTGANPLPDVRRFAEALQERIDTNTTDAPPLVFVVDELAYCSRQKYFPTFQAMFDRISTEGRKVRVYLLASSQDLRFRKTGDFRDTLSSSFLFNLKSGQVKAFTQDNDLTKLHKVVRVANAPGLALLDLTDGEPAIIKTPFCSPNDARFLPLHNAPAARGEEITSGTIEETNAEENTSQDVLNAQNSNVIPFPKREPANEISTNGEPGAFDVKTLRESAGLSQGKFAELTGCSLSKLKRVETGGGSFDADEIQAILTNLNAWRESSEPANQLRTNGEPGTNQRQTNTEPTNHTREA